MQIDNKTPIENETAFIDQQDDVQPGTYDYQLFDSNGDIYTVEEQIREIMRAAKTPSEFKLINLNGSNSPDIDYDVLLLVFRGYGYGFVFESTGEHNTTIAIIDAANERNGVGFVASPSTTIDDQGILMDMAKNVAPDVNLRYIVNSLTIPAEVEIDETLCKYLLSMAYNDLINLTGVVPTSKILPSNSSLYINPVKKQLNTPLGVTNVTWETVLNKESSTNVVAGANQKKRGGTYLTASGVVDVWSTSVERQDRGTGASYLETEHLPIVLARTIVSGTNAFKQGLDVSLIALTLVDVMAQGGNFFMPLLNDPNSIGNISRYGGKPTKIDNTVSLDEKVTFVNSVLPASVGALVGLSVDGMTPSASAAKVFIDLGFGDKDAGVKIVQTMNKMSPHFPSNYPVNDILDRFIILPSGIYIDDNGKEIDLNELNHLWWLNFSDKKSSMDYSIRYANIMTMSSNPMGDMMSLYADALGANKVIIKGDRYIMVFNPSFLVTIANAVSKAGVTPMYVNTLDIQTRNTGLGTSNLSNSRRQGTGGNGYGNGERHNYRGMPSSRGGAHRGGRY